MPGHLFTKLRVVPLPPPPVLGDDAQNFKFMCACMETIAKNQLGLQQQLQTIQKTVDLVGEQTNPQETFNVEKHKSEWSSQSACGVRMR